MSYIIQEVKDQGQFCEKVDLAALTQVISPELIETIIESSGVREQRIRKLPAGLTLLMCVGMNIFRELRLSHVLLRLTSGARWLNEASVEMLANDSSISAARYQLGVKPLHLLFQQLCKPLASADTPGAFAFGLRLVALDGMCHDVADTPANDAYFGRPTGSFRSPWPQVQGVYLCECGTHVIFDAYLAPYATSEYVGAYRLLRSITPQMLVMLDRGLYSADLFIKIRQRGAHLLARLPSYVKPEVLCTLADGSYWAYLAPGDYQQRKAGNKILVRIITYTIDDPTRPGHGEIHRLVTTLLDPNLYPVIDVILLYHERWEEEITFDEIETHLHWPNTPLRSLKPLGVLQELYALLIAHFVLRSLVVKAAATQGLDPDRLSFVHAIRIFSEAIPFFQITHPLQHAILHQRLLADIAHPRFQLPPRDHRVNPRVVKRRTSSFQRKQARHYDLPQPTAPFREVISILPQPP